MPRAVCQPAVWLGDSPARGLGLVKSSEALKGFSSAVGMSWCWVPHCHCPGTAAGLFRSRWGSSFYSFSSTLWDNLMKSLSRIPLFKELVFADGKKPPMSRSRFPQQRAHTPAVGQAVPKLPAHTTQPSRAHLCYRPAEHF